MITLTGSSNAINLTDGLDGLAIRCTVTVALTYGIMAYASGNFVIADYLMISWVPGTGELAVVCSALLEEVLLYASTYILAEVFMGDTVHWPLEVWSDCLDGSSTIHIGHCRR